MTIFAVVVCFVLNYADTPVRMVHKFVWVYFTYSAGTEPIEMFGK